MQAYHNKARKNWITKNLLPQKRGIIMSHLIIELAPNSLMIYSHQFKEATSGKKEVKLFKLQDQFHP